MTNTKEKKEQTPKSRKKTYFFISLLLALAVAFTIFYFIGNSKFSPHNQITAFEEAVTDNQVDDLQQLLHSDHENFEITGENTEALLTYLNNNENILHALINKFEGQAEETAEQSSLFASIDLTADGKQWLFFDDYSFEVTPAYLQPMASHEQIDFLINGSNAEDAAPHSDLGYGPVMPGSYDITAVFDNSFVTEEQSATIELYETASEEAVHSFDFSIEEVTVHSNEDDYKLYVNGEETDIEIQEGEQSIGEFPNDGSVTLSIGKDFPWGEVVSSEKTINEEEFVEFEVEHTLSEEVKQDIMEKMNTVFASYQEAITASDSSLLAENVTDTLKDKLDNRIEEVDEMYPDYEGTLIRVVYDEEYFSEPEFNEELNAYVVTLRAHHFFYEPNGDLGWVFMDEEKDEYRRTNELIVIFNEVENEWQLEDYGTSYHIIPDSRAIDFEL